MNFNVIRVIGIIYIGYTSRHLHLRIEEHKYSVVGKHLKDKHNERLTNLHEQFNTLKKCLGKFECLIAFNEVERKPNLGLWLSGVGVPV